MKKRFLAVFLALALCLGLMPATALAAGETSGTCGENVTWNFDPSTGTLTISGTGPMEDYFPEAPWCSFDNLIKTAVIQDGVTTIGGYAFSGCSSLTSVTITESVTEIGSSAFAYCASLTSVVIPDSVTEIAGYTFDGCTSLTSIVIPESVTEIGFGAFLDCTSLASIVIPNSVTTIGREAFAGTPWLAAQGDFPVANGILLGYQGEGGAITIPNSVTTIGGRTFEYCDSLTSVVIPDSVTEIGFAAFFNCSSLTSVVIPDSVTNIGGIAFDHTPWLLAQGDFPVVNGILLEYRGEGGAITIPNSVTKICDSAFSGCTSLTSVVIPDSVTAIGREAFYDCTALTSVTLSIAIHRNMAFI